MLKVNQFYLYKFFVLMQFYFSFKTLINLIKILKINILKIVIFMLKKDLKKK